MKKLITILFVLKVAITFGQTPATDPTWELMVPLSDEFNPGEIYTIPSPSGR